MSESTKDQAERRRKTIRRRWVEALCEANCKALLTRGLYSQELEYRRNLLRFATKHGLVITHNGVFLEEEARVLDIVGIQPEDLA